MSTWSGIRHKLETEYLAPSLRGHIQYFATSRIVNHLIMRAGRLLDIMGRKL